MARSEADDPKLALVTWIGFALAVAALYLARGVLLPLALAALLAFVLAPLVRRLDRFLPALASVLVVTSLAFGVLAGVGMVVADQTFDIAASIPRYRENIKDRLRDLSRSPDTPIREAAKAVEEIQEEVKEEVAAEEKAAAAEEEPEPVSVRVVEDPTPVTVLRGYVSPALPPLLTGGIVIVFTIFLLLQRRDLQERLIRLGGKSRLTITTRAMKEASRTITRFLQTQLLINVLYGIPVALALWAFGLPGALLWGLLATVLRFIPFVGPWIAAALPIVLSLAVFDGWSRPLGIIGFFIVLEIFSNNVLEPWLYGSSTGLSPIAVLVAAVFWSWLWGPLGLVLGVPLTACLVVLGRHVPQLETLTILFGTDPALSPATRFYQRLLAMDDDGAEEVAEEHLRGEGREATFDEVLVPALHLMERDRHSGTVPDDQARPMLDSLRSIAEEMIEAEDELLDAREAPSGPPVLCVAAADEADTLAGSMLALLLVREGTPAEVVPAVGLVSELVERVRSTGARRVVISALPPAAIPRARGLVKRLRAVFPQLEIVVGLWDWNGDLLRARRRLVAAGANEVVRTFKDALERVGGPRARPLAAPV